MKASLPGFRRLTLDLRPIRGLLLASSRGKVAGRIGGQGRKHDMAHVVFLALNGCCCCSTVAILACDTLLKLVGDEAICNTIKGKSCIRLRIIFVCLLYNHDLFLTKPAKYVRRLNYNLTMISWSLLCMYAHTQNIVVFMASTTSIILVHVMAYGNDNMKMNNQSHLITGNTVLSSGWSSRRQSDKQTTEQCRLGVHCHDFFF